MAQAKPSDQVKQPKGRNPLARLRTVKQVCEAKGVPASTVYRAIQEGRLVVWQQGDSYMIPEEAAREWQPRQRAKKPKEIPDDS